jgi:hypothetical protein
MALPKEFNDLLKSVGRSMAEVNPGSDEIALPLNRVEEAINLLEQNSNPILGGDLIREDGGGKLRYAFGSWSCSLKPGETSGEYLPRCYQAAREYLRSVIQLHPTNAYLVLVLRT